MNEFDLQFVTDDWPAINWFDRVKYSCYWKKEKGWWKWSGVKHGAKLFYSEPSLAQTHFQAEQNITPYQNQQMGSHVWKIEPFPKTTRPCAVVLATLFKIHKCIPLQCQNFATGHRPASLSEWMVIYMVYQTRKVISKLSCLETDSLFTISLP